MKVFVTGGTGLLGSFVIQELLEFSYQPVVLIRNKDDVKQVDPACTCVEGDVLDVLSLKRGMEGCQFLIHCAAIVSFDLRKSKDMYAVNVEGTSNVANACLQMGISKIIHVSSIAALGRSFRKPSLTETSEWTESNLNTNYAKSKYLAELEIFRAGEEGLNFTIINPSIIIARGEKKRSSVRLLHQIVRFPYGYPNGYLNVIDVRDVAKAIVATIFVQHPGRLILNWGSISYEELYRMIRTFLDIRGPLVQIPPSLLQLISFISTVKSYVTGGEPFISNENLRLLGHRFEYSSEFFHEFFPLVVLRSPQESINWAIPSLLDQN